MSTRLAIGAVGLLALASAVSDAGSPNTLGAVPSLVVPFSQLTRETRPLVKGAVIYEGPSRIDGKPIVALLQYESSNPKTGNVPQVWIFPADVSPNEARKLGEDVRVCGGCIFSRNRGCYVSGRALWSVWRSYQAGNYSDRRHAEWYFKRERPPTVRIGAYGDPVAVPIEVWEWLSGLPGETNIIGYTQEWKLPRADGYQRFCMASTKSRAESRKAELMGWRYFRVTVPGDEVLLERQIMCPHTTDDENICKGCRLCTGGDLSSDQRPHIVNPVHGVTVKRATAGLERLRGKGSSNRRGSAWLWSRGPERIHGRAEVVDVLPTARSRYGKYQVRDLASGDTFEVPAAVPGLRRGRVLPAGTVLSYSHQGFDDSGAPISATVLGAELSQQAARALR